MTGSDLAKMYEFSYGAINRNVEGVTEEESLVQAATRGQLPELGTGPHRAYIAAPSSRWSAKSRFAARRKQFRIAGEVHPARAIRCWIWRRCAGTLPIRNNG
jgi:hypothetical protein